jgi:hypothetical protein
MVIVMKIIKFLEVTASWEIAPRSLVEVDRRFTGAYCLHHQGESSVYFNLKPKMEHD